MFTVFRVCLFTHWRFANVYIDFNKMAPMTYAVKTMKEVSHRNSVYNNVYKNSVYNVKASWLLPSHFALSFCGQWAILLFNLNANVILEFYLTRNAKKLRYSDNAWIRKYSKLSLNNCKTNLLEKQNEKETTCLISLKNTTFLEPMRKANQNRVGKYE